MLGGISVVPAASQAAMTNASSPACEAELNKAVALFNEGHSDESRKLLVQLAERCPEYPQVHHNLGVVAAAERQWQPAIDHFERAIANDTRTNMTQRHLHSIHEFKAAMAYREALGMGGVASPPNMAMQLASKFNSTTQPILKTQHHDVSAVEYELYAWWQAAANSTAEQWLEHYSSGYPTPDLTKARQRSRDVDWSSVERQISFTAQDAVVVLTFPGDSDNQQSLLLMHLQDNRWKIFQESGL